MNRFDQPSHCRRVNGILKPMPAIASPVHQVAASPAGFALNAVLEIDHDLYLADRVDLALINMSGTKMPKSFFRHRVLVGQRPRPEKMNMRILDRLIG
jgi:hypothetical protein